MVTLVCRLYHAFYPSQVFDMFRQHGRGGYGGHGAPSSPALSSGVDKKDRIDDDRDQRTPTALSPAALRAGLRSLGVPLGDRDFDALVATTDPDNRGKVSYPMFCEALNLHRLHGDEDGGGAAASAGQRPSSAPPRSASCQPPGQYVEAVGVGTTAAAGGGARGGGYARRRAMELAPPPDARTDLEGGVFHLNSATHGCANPNFTTTMIPARGRDGGQAPDDYRPKRRQSRDVARTKAHKQNLLVVGGGDSSELWKETGAEAERRFRQGFGVKMRYHDGRGCGGCRTQGSCSRFCAQSRDTLAWLTSVMFSSPSVQLCLRRRVMDVFTFRLTQISFRPRITKSTSHRSVLCAPFRPRPLYQTFTIPLFMPCVRQRRMARRRHPLPSPRTIPSHPFRQPRHGHCRW